MLLHRVLKPALLQNLFYLACEYAGQILPYSKMLGQLNDDGNTTTLAHYQVLLEEAFILRGLPKWTGTALRRRASSPKWIPLNTALVSAISGKSFDEWKNDRNKWGRLVETAVGAHLINNSFGKGYEVYYWRDRDREVDYVLRKGTSLVGIEVKTGHRSSSSGLTAFKKRYNPVAIYIVGSEGFPLREFLEYDPQDL